MSIDCSKYLEVSSRLANRDNGTYQASCNLFVVEDCVDPRKDDPTIPLEESNGLADVLAWTAKISGSSGAPTVVWDKIRPKGSLTRHGIATAGVCRWVQLVDQVAQVMKRPHKKNSASVMCLSLDHPDCPEFMSAQFASTLTTVFLTVLIEPGKTYSPELVAQLIDAYENRRCFICKTDRDDEGNILYSNVCTEIRMQHKGQCVLAAIKLHEMADLSVEQFRDAFHWMAHFICQQYSINLKNHKLRPELFNDERQVGLGFVGMANFIGKLGTTYQSIVVEWETGDGNEGAKRFWTLMKTGFKAGSAVQAAHKIKRMWTSQPTAHTSLRLSDDGFAVAPELAPVIGGARNAVDNLVRIHRKATADPTKDMLLTFPAYVQSQEDVPYEIFRRFCCYLAEAIEQSLVEGCAAHTFSHLYYGDEFTAAEFNDFLDSPLKSLYYRIDPLFSTMDKTETGDDAGDISDLFEEEESIEGFCPIDPYERTQCEACSM